MKNSTILNSNIDSFIEEHSVRDDDYNMYKTYTNFELFSFRLNYKDNLSDELIENLLNVKKEINADINFFKQTYIKDLEIVQHRHYDDIISNATIDITNIVNASDYEITNAFGAGDFFELIQPIWLENEQNELFELLKIKSDFLEQKIASKYVNLNTKNLIEFLKLYKKIRHLPLTKKYEYISLRKYIDSYKNGVKIKHCIK